MISEAHALTIAIKGLNSGLLRLSTILDSFYMPQLLYGQQVVWKLLTTIWTFEMLLPEINLLNL